MTFDALRLARPELGLALYALESGGGVTLEVYDKGELYQFHGATADDAIRSAFPPVVSQTPLGAGLAPAFRPTEQASTHTGVASSGGVAETTSVFD